MTVRCEVCRINIAQVKDYRHSGVGYDKYLVCPNCFILDDRWFFKLKYAKEGVGKKKVMSRITDGTWKDYLTRE